MFNLLVVSLEHRIVIRQPCSAMLFTGTKLTKQPSVINAYFVQGR